MDTKTAVIAGVVGFALGFIAAKRVLAGNYEALVEAEILEAKEHYKTLARNEIKKAHEATEFTEAEVQRVLNDRRQTASEAADAMMSYRGKVEELEKAGNWEKPSNDIHVISLDDYYNGEVGYDQYAFEYFAGDEKLVGESERLLTDEEIERTVGKENLTKFGEKSENDDAVYIRNPKLKMDIAVSRTHHYYGPDPNVSV